MELTKKEVEKMNSYLRKICTEVVKDKPCRYRAYNWTEKAILIMKNAERRNNSNNN